MRALLIWGTAAIIFCCGRSDNWAADPELKFNLLTLPSVRVAAEQLDAPAQVFGERITLRATTAQLAQVYQFSYWIDRQVDADKPLSLPLTESTLGQCLSRLAQQCDAEVGLVENVVTIAAPARLTSMQYTAARLHDHLSRGLPAVGNRSAGNSTELRPLAWPMLTTPTELYQAIGKTWDFGGAVDLPHDLMEAGQLHPCTAATQLTLLLGGFDRCAVGRQLSDLRIAPMPKASSWQAVYSGLPEANIAAATAEFPDARFSRAGKQIVFSGTAAAHLRLLYGRPRPATSSVASRTGRQSSGQGQTTQRQGANSREDALLKQGYTIKLDQPQPLRSVMTDLARQLGLELKWSEALTPVDMQRGVKLNVNKAELDDIFEALAAQAGVSIVRQGLSVEVAPQITSER